MEKTYQLTEDQLGHALIAFTCLFLHAQGFEANEEGMANVTKCFLEYKQEILDRIESAIQKP